jgi:hypothetical protein
MEVKLNKSNENPFYGMKDCLKIMQNVGGNITNDMLDGGYAECKTKEQREMFFSLLFSIGDITARQHNIFKGNKRDSGGNANREGFITVLDWMRNKHKEQFIKFLNAGLFNEYSCFDLLLRNRIQTKRTRVVRTHNVLAVAGYRAAIVEYLYKVINGTNPFDKLLVAKFLTLPRLSKRSGHKKMLPETKKVMEDKAKLLITLSEQMGWKYTVTPTIANFIGYREWRKQYNGTLESVLFSTGKIKEFSKDEFIKWFDQLPAQARFRVKNRILYSKVKDTDDPKYPKFQDWYLEWEMYKEKKQEEQRVLEEKVRQGQATEEDVVKLNKVKKEAKVTVGATSFNDIYDDILNNRVDKLKLESFINKVNLPYNSLVIIDDSGSMSGEPFNFATFLASVCLVKNPDDDGRNLLGFFDYSSHWYGYIDRKANETPNWMMRKQVAKTKATPFVNPKASFYENYLNIKSFCNAVFNGGGTNISAIPEGLRQACKENPEVLDALKAYPVWTIISDGEWNNLSSPEASLNDFMRKCETYFGFKPFIVAIDVAGRYFSTARADRFSGIDNFMYIPSNPAQIEQFLTNFKDMDIYDAYTPLQSLYRSNRYDVVRANVL